MSSTKYIKKVAIVGASGHVGEYFVNELLKTGKHKVTAVSRKESKATFPAAVNVARVDYSDPSTIVTALRGHDFLIITLNVQIGNPGRHKTIVKAAIEAGVQWIMPNCYGFDIRKDTFRDMDIPMSLVANADEVKELGGYFVAMCCGFWYEWSLAIGEQWYGFDIKNRTVTFFDDGKTKIPTSTWLQCGRALAALLSLPVEKGDGEGLALEQWKNKPLLVDSFYASQRDMLDSLHRVLGTTDDDWQIKFEPTDKRVKDGKAELAAGDFRGFAKQLYSRAFYPNGDADFLSESDNKILGLPVEDLDEATKRAVEMVESGWVPFSNTAH